MCESSFEVMILQPFSSTYPIQGRGGGGVEPTAKMCLAPSQSDSVCSLTFTSPLQLFTPKHADRCTESRVIGLSGTRHALYMTTRETVAEADSMHFKSDFSLVL